MSCSWWEGAPYVAGDRSPETAGDFWGKWSCQVISIIFWEIESGGHMLQGKPPQGYRCIPHGIARVFSTRVRSGTFFPRIRYVLVPMD